MTPEPAPHWTTDAITGKSERTTQLAGSDAGHDWIATYYGGVMRTVHCEHCGGSPIAFLTVDNRFVPCTQTVPMG